MANAGANGARARLSTAGHSWLGRRERAIGSGRDADARRTGPGREPQMDERELGAIRAGRGDCHLDPPHRDSDLCAELEQFQADRAAGGVLELSVAQADASQGLEQHVGEGREPQT